MKDFWSVIVYDNQTRSMLQTDQKAPSVSSQCKQPEQGHQNQCRWFGGWVVWPQGPGWI
jgi:hypothetical protein